MGDQPDRAEQRLLLRPNAHQPRIVIPDKAGQLTNAQATGSSFRLNAGAVTAQGDSCSLQRLSHEQRAEARSRRSDVTNQAMARQSVAALRAAVLGHVARRRVQGKAECTKLAAHQARGSRSCEPYGHIRFSPGEVQTPNTGDKFDLQLGIAFTECGEVRNDHMRGQCLRRGQPDGAGQLRIVARHASLKVQGGDLHRFALPQDGLTRRTCSEALRGPDEELRPELPLERSNSATDSHMIHSQRPGGSGEAAFARDGQEETDVVPLPSVHGHRCAFSHNRCAEKSSCRPPLARLASRATSGGYHADDDSGKMRRAVAPPRALGGVSGVIGSHGDSLYARALGAVAVPDDLWSDGARPRCRSYDA